MASEAKAFDVRPRLINLISTREEAFEESWPEFKELVESIEAESWPDIHERHALLRIAALRGREEAVKLLLKSWRKPDVEKRQPGTGETALHEAAYNGYATIVELLLKRGAIPDLLTFDTGESALHRALSRPRFKKPRPPINLEGTVRFLLKAGANPNLKDKQWQTPVHHAARNSHANSLRLLLENSSKQGNRDSLDRKGNTPLHLAALAGHVEEAEILLGDAAEHINAENKRKETPLYLAASHEHANHATEWSKYDDTVRLLLAQGADTTHQKINGLTMLDWAVNNSSKSNAANLILHKEYMSWPASWFQEPDAHWRKIAPLPELDHEIARGVFKASAMWFYLHYEQPVKREAAADHTKCYWSSVEDMVYSAANSSSIYDKLNPESKEGFVWFNIPENNMQWVVDLHHRLYNDQRGSQSDAAQIDPQSFLEWFHASRPHQLTPQFRQDVHCGSKRIVRNMFISIPYLSVESHKRRLEYEKTIYESQPFPQRNSNLANEKNLCRYKYLVSTYGVDYESGLLRKTLDKYHYHNLGDTARRDESQVILRASQARKSPKEKDFEKKLLEGDEFDHFRSQWWPQDKVPSGELDGPSIRDRDGDVLMVDQACLWILGDDTIITSFPSSWKAKSIETDPLTRILEFLEEPNRPPITSVSEFAAFVVLHCSTMHTPSWRSSFNSIINMTADLQVSHFQSFVRSSRITENAAEYRQPQAKRNELKNAEDDLTSIRHEVKNLCEVNDIQDELHIIERILHEQAGVVQQLVATSASQPMTWQCHRLRLQQAHLQEAIGQGHADVKEMLDNAERTHAAILQLLDLKQQQATVTESRSARKQSEDTARQNDTVQLFTFVTIIFTPASFMAAFFAIPDLALPGIDTSRLDGAVGTIVVFSTVIWLPIIAYIFFVDRVRNWFEQREARRRSSPPSTGSGRTAVHEPFLLGGGGGSGKGKAAYSYGQTMARLRPRSSLGEKTGDVEQGTVSGKA